MVGLMLMLGSGMPIGKSGPFVHIASVIATQLSLFITSFKSLFEFVKVITTFKKISQTFMSTNRENQKC